MITETEAEYRLDAVSPKETPYLALTGELWGVFCEYLWENWPRYNGTALYSDILAEKSLRHDWPPSMFVSLNCINYININERPKVRLYGERNSKGFVEKINSKQWNTLFHLQNMLIGILFLSTALNLLWTKLSVGDSITKKNNR